MSSQPSLLGKEASIAMDTTFRTSIECDADIRENLYSNDVLSPAPAQPPGNSTFVSNFVLGVGVGEQMYTHLLLCSSPPRNISDCTLEQG